MTTEKNSKFIASQRRLQAKLDQLTFADILKSERLSDRISQEKAAKMLGISKKYLSDLENGRRFPCLEFAKMAAEKFGDHPKIWQDYLKKDIENASKKRKNITMPASQVLLMFQALSKDDI